MSSEAKNLKAIVEAIKYHDDHCEFPTIEVRLNPYEHERLDWESIQGVPLVADPDIGTGRFRIVCENEPTLEEEKEVADAIAKDKMIYV